MATACFTEDTYRFLKDLKKNNDRDWFDANKKRYEEHLKDPALRIIAAFAPELKKISPHFMATPRSLFRIYRDVRFAKDKSPYKTHIGLHFRHDRSKDAHAPGFYLHVEPKQAFIGVGIWHPDGPALRSIR
ncbi:MAG: TIGR02453 family protein, partial [Gemmatimonadota bacterium]|nr:TIGR02453 family protein [Gemmatimonadota bacterium]